MFLFLSIIKRTRLSLLLLSLHYFLSFSIALIVYKIGYGFDPFIHRATVKLIDEKGFILPKNIYYLGQYSLVVLIHKATFLPINLIDKLLVPFLTAISLPAFFYNFLNTLFKSRRKNLIIILFQLIIPFTAFILTTPQSLGYLFLLLLILHSLNSEYFSDLPVIFIFALASLAAHPMAGIPAIFFTLFIVVRLLGKKYHFFKKRKKPIYGLILLISAISLPLSFYIFNTKIKVGFSFLNTLGSFFSSILHFSLPVKENVILNFVYLYAFNIKFFILALIVVGIYLVLRRSHNEIFNFYIFMAISLLISYILLSSIDFSYLISYEQQDYIERLNFLMLLFLTPFILIALNAILKKILQQNTSLQIIYFTFITALLGCSLYTSYPRFDNYYNSHGYSVGSTDIKAVKLIEENSLQNYVVLANQQVSVAALNEFGFDKRYYNGYYFYPIPTSSPFYQLYLDMVYEKPTRQTVAQAAKLADVKQAYFILNKYWWAADKIIDDVYILDNSVYIFKYDF